MERIVGDGRVVILFGYADYVFACRVYAETAYDAQPEHTQIGVRVCEQRLEGYGEQAAAQQGRYLRYVEWRKPVGVCGQTPYGRVGVGGEHGRQRIYANIGIAAACVTFETSCT